MSEVEFKMAELAKERYEQDLTELPGGLLELLEKEVGNGPVG